MKVSQIISQIQVQKGKVSLYEELIDHCNSLQEGVVEIVCNDLIENKEKIFSEIVSNLINTKVELSKEIDRLNRSEVKSVKSNSRAPRKAAARKRTTKQSNPT